MPRHIFLVVILTAAHAKCPLSGRHGDLPNPHENHRLLSDLPSHIAPATTNQGCVCQTTCGAALALGEATCDWCYTSNNCGRESPEGRWDYCAYPEDVSYENQTAAAKVATLWSQLTTNQSSDAYGPVDVNTVGVQTAFDIGGDTMPTGRVKAIHPVGTVCKFDFAVSSSSPYTGLLGPGASSQGFVRMGPGNTPIDKSSGLSPGLGIKLLRSGVQSGNFVAMVSLDELPNKSYNFFEAPFTNHFPTPFPESAMGIMEKFSQASTCPLKVGLSDLTKYDARGVQAGTNVFPFKIELRSLFQLKSEPMTEDELLDQLTKVPVGVPFFEVWAYDSPTSVAPQKIGAMVPNESCVKSNFGDVSFHVRHQRVEEDWALRPEWLGQMDARKECVFLDVLTTVPPQRCSER